MAAWGIGSLLMAGLGVWLAHGTLRAVNLGWQTDLARAAVLVAAVGALLAVVAIIGAFVH